MALQGTGIPFVYVNIGDPRFWAASWHRRLRVRAFLKRAAAVVALSEAVRQIYIRDFALADKSVEVIPNHRSAVVFKPLPHDERASRRAQLGLRGGDFLVVYLGALAPEKRVDVAIDAIGHTDDLRLWIAGAGPEEARLQRRASRLEGRVRFLGSVEDPAALLSVADCLVLTSDSEGMPGVLIEAGLSGVPCVATDVGWVREIILDGVTGILAPRDDPRSIASALQRVREQAPTMSARAVTHCRRNLETEVALDRWESLLRAVPAER
jgi:glycosyltransferase involved in cell wall biosynthesis